MKWRIHRDPSKPATPWRAVGWTWNADLDEWLRVCSWQPTHAAALTVVGRLRSTRPNVEEPPC